jgi:hypothetical protein
MGDRVHLQIPVAALLVCIMKVNNSIHKSFAQDRNLNGLSHSMSSCPNSL